MKKSKGTREKRENNPVIEDRAVNSGHYSLPVTPKDSKRTSFGPICSLTFASAVCVNPARVQRRAIQRRKDISSGQRGSEDYKGGG